MKRFSSHKGISGLSPHNILYSIYYRKAVKRMRYVIFVWRGSVRTESLASLTRMVSSPPSARFLRHFRVPFNPLKGHIMGRLLSACGTEQDITQEMVLYQRVSRPFLHRFPTDRVDCMKPLCHAGTQKSATCGERAVEALPGRTYIGFHTFANNRIPASMSLPRHKSTIA